MASGVQRAALCRAALCSRANSFERPPGFVATPFCHVNTVNLFRQCAPIIAKVLRGSKPSEVPAELPTKFELVVNIKTAKRLGIVFPTSILLRADEVIE